MYEIQISNNQRLLQINDSFVEDVVSKTFSAQAVVSAEIVVALVTDDAIHQVNRDHLQHDYATDVISFLYEETSIKPVQELNDQQRGAGLHLDGEIVVSSETAIREAKEYGWAPEHELQLYIVHGLLHLCGYDDLREEEQTIMRQQERQTLKIWNLEPHYRD